MPDLMKIGGVSGWMRAAALAQARELAGSSHLWPELSAQLLCCTPTAHWLEYADWWNPILKAPQTLEKGMAIVDDAIGSGVEWNQDAVDEYLIEVSPQSARAINTRAFQTGSEQPFEVFVQQLR